MSLLGRIAAALRVSPQGPETFGTPSVTRGQQLAVGQAVVAVLVVLGADLDSDTQQLLIGLSAALAAVIPISDTAIRRNRARYAEQIQAAQQRQESATGSDELAPSPAQRRRLAVLQARLASRDTSTQ